MSPPCLTYNTSLPPATDHDIFLGSLEPLIIYSKYADGGIQTRNSGESFYAYFIEDGDVVYDPPEETPVPSPPIIDRGRFREAVDVRNSDLIPDGHRVRALVGDNSSSSDQEGVSSPVAGNRPTGDKRRKRISQVILNASKRSKRRMTNCTIQ